MKGNKIINGKEDLLMIKGHCKGEEWSYTKKKQSARKDKGRMRKGRARRSKWMHDYKGQRTMNDKGALQRVAVLILEKRVLGRIKGG